MSAPSRHHILIVEDNRDFAAGLAFILRSQGFEVETVYDGREALKVSRSHPPDLVLLDLGLPGMDGFQVAQAMREDPDLKDVKIVAVSGYDEDMFPVRAHGASFDGHLVKPVDFEHISAVLARYCGSGDS